MFKKDVFHGRERLVNSQRWQTVQKAFSVKSVCFFLRHTVSVRSACGTRAITIHDIIDTSYLELQFS